MATMKNFSQRITSLVKAFRENPIYFDFLIQFFLFLLLHLIYRGDPLQRIVLYVVLLIYSFHLLFKPYSSTLGSNVQNNNLKSMNFIVALFVFFHFAFLIARLNQGHLADIGDTTLQSVKLLFSGQNPYQSEIDSVALSYMGEGFGGFKYLPIMTLIYAPLSLLLDYRGIQITNFILNLIISFLIFDIVKEKTGNTVYGKLASILYLSPFLIFSLLYAKGVTDLAPVLFMILAFKLRDKASFVSGLMLGLSISCKLLPGLVLIPILFNGENKIRYVVGGVIGLIPIYCVALLSPEAFLNNIILFNLMRPIPDSSWFLWFPTSVLFVIKTILFIVIAAIYILNLMRQQSLAHRFAEATIVVILTILLSADTPQNYNLWWIPLLICAAALKTTDHTIRSQQFGKMRF